MAVGAKRAASTPERNQSGSSRSALQTVFYRCKNEAGDLTPDGDLLRLLRRAFDKAGGSTDYLEGLSLAELAQWVREEKHGTD